MTGNLVVCLLFVCSIMSHCPDAAELWLVCTGVATAVDCAVLMGTTAVDMQPTNCPALFNFTQYSYAKRDLWLWELSKM